MTVQNTYRLVSTLTYSTKIITLQLKVAAGLMGSPDLLHIDLSDSDEDKQFLMCGSADGAVQVWS